MWGRGTELGTADAWGDGGRLVWGRERGRGTGDVGGEGGRTWVWRGALRGLAPARDKRMRLTRMWYLLGTCINTFVIGFKVSCA